MGGARPTRQTCWCLDNKSRPAVAAGWAGPSPAPGGNRGGETRGYRHFSGFSSRHHHSAQTVGVAQKRPAGLAENSPAEGRVRAIRPPVRHAVVAPACYFGNCKRRVRISGDLWGRAVNQRLKFTLSISLAVSIVAGAAWLFRYSLIAAPSHPVAFRLDRWTGEVCTVFARGDTVCPTPPKAIEVPASVFEGLEEK